MNARKIEVRYIAARMRWKATLLVERRPSVYGSDAEDAVSYLCKMLQIPGDDCRCVSKAKDRVVYDIEIPTELVDTRSD